MTEQNTTDGVSLSVNPPHLRQRYAGLFEALVALLAEYDPMNLVARGAPSDEYTVEVDGFLLRLPDSDSPEAMGQIFLQIFQACFGTTFSLADSPAVQARFQLIGQRAWTGWRNWLATQQAEDEAVRSNVVSTSSLAIRPLRSLAEYTRYYGLSNSAFSDDPSEEEALMWRDRSLNSPDFRPERVRGAFHAEQLMGAYTISDRSMRLGAARISTGCIGGVVTAPEARQQGVAREMMRDSQEFAREQGHSLLLLDGIPKFYYRFGYTDILDLTYQEIDRASLLALPAATDYTIRPATIEDAAAILALYLDCLGAYTGSFDRSLENQAYRLKQQRAPHAVALAPDGHIAGYLIYGREAEVADGYEVASESAEAFLALLQYHAGLANGETPPTALRYHLPPRDALTQHLIDLLQVPDTSPWGSPLEGWSVRSQSYHHRWAGWMACLIDWPQLLAELLPALQERWQNGLARWDGEILLGVEAAGGARVLRFAGETITLQESASSQAEDGADHALWLTRQDAVQLVFGYRPLAYFRQASQLAPRAFAALNVLFPPEHCWIPRTDWF